MNPPPGSAPDQQPSVRLGDFNRLAPADAAALLRPCLDVDRWVRDLTEGRPYASRDDLLVAAHQAACLFHDAELEAALAHHPRIGERAAGASSEAAMSRSEQQGLAGDEEVSGRLHRGNQDYENRFGRVFLIRAAGRSTEEILDALEQRLGNDPATEDAVVADQLRQIALLRLAGRVA